MADCSLLTIFLCGVFNGFDFAGATHGMSYGRRGFKIGDRVNMVGLGWLILLRAPPCISAKAYRTADSQNTKFVIASVNLRNAIEQLITPTVLSAGLKKRGG